VRAAASDDASDTTTRPSSFYDHDHDRSSRWQSVRRSRSIARTKDGTAMRDPKSSIVVGFIWSGLLLLLLLLLLHIDNSSEIMIRSPSLTHSHSLLTHIGEPLKYRSHQTNATRSIGSEGSLACGWLARSLARSLGMLQERVLDLLVTRLGMDQHHGVAATHQQSQRASASGIARRGALGI